MLRPKPHTIPSQTGRLGLGSKIRKNAVNRVYMGDFTFPGARAMNTIIADMASPLTSVVTVVPSENLMVGAGKFGA